MRTSAQADLDAAIDAKWQAVTATPARDCTLHRDGVPEVTAVPLARAATPAVPATPLLKGT